MVTGKGGVGKTTLTALLAHSFAREGKQVLAIDGDPQQNLGVTLGLPLSQAKRIISISERKEYIAEKIGYAPGKGGFMVLNPETADVVNRYGVMVGERIRLLVLGGVRNAGSGCLCPEYMLLSAVLRGAAYLPEEVVLLDTPAGLEHFGRSIAQGFTIALIVTDSSYNAMAVAKDLARLAVQSGIKEKILVMNMSGPGTRKNHGKDLEPVYFKQIWSIPADHSIREQEPSVIPVLQNDTPAVKAVRGLMLAMSPEKGGRE